MFRGILSNVTYSLYIAYIQCLDCEKLARGLNFSTLGARRKLECKSYVYSRPYIVDPPEHNLTVC